MNRQEAMPYNPSELTRSVKDGNHAIDLIIQTVNRLYQDIQLQNAYEVTDGVIEEITEEHMVLTSRSTGCETLEDTNLDQSTTGGGEGASMGRSAPSVYQIRKLQVALHQLKCSLKTMRRLQLDVENELNEQLGLLSKVVKGEKVSETLHKRETKRHESDIENITNKLQDLMKKVFVLKKQKKKKALPDQEDYKNRGSGIVCLPGVHENKHHLKTLEVFSHVKNIFIGLDMAHRICLLSFAVFPENKEVNGTMLMYWWIGEGILSVEVKSEEGILPDEVESKKDVPEGVAKAILKKFTDENLIEPVENKRKMEPSGYKMSPFVHSSVVIIAKEIGLFDIYREGRSPSMNKSKLRKVCLVEGSSDQAEAKGKRMAVADIETVFNVSEKFPDFTSNWFSSMKKLKVLYLGQWERAKSEIEVNSLLLMKGLSSLRRLRFLSLQGISNISSLSRSACNLPNLIILDLRGCYNLTKLPEEIHKLQNLVYLDMSGCETLENIPIGLAMLSKLKVLKGFVVSDDKVITCELIDLKGLLNLRKLSVTVERENFGLDELIKAIKSFEALEMLKVRWGSGFTLTKKQEHRDAGKMIQKEKDSKAGTIPGSTVEPCLPKQLRKLDLQRFPDSKLPGWLQPQNLKGLKKLYLRSSRFKRFGDSPLEEPTSCSVEILRLVCLPKLRVEWTELRKIYFPNLRFLESYECPRVTFCPCDGDGIWKTSGGG